MISMAKPKRQTRASARVTKQERRVVTVRNAILLRDLARKLPEKPSAVTLRRYCRQGVKSPVTLEVVTMEFVYLPFGLASNEDAYYKFLERLNGDED